MNLVGIVHIDPTLTPFDRRLAMYVDLHGTLPPTSSVDKSSEVHVQSEFDVALDEVSKTVPRAIYEALRQ